ncbi:voltage-gated chloride channel [Methanocella sp. CWC-04]|uniref:Voltage-gated chloride channel n=1 Tax=Methanooceanicella nereidis TaxID=2052831 RepID=A0AAP2REX2_9EURY|nr:chloride channel protein [Methanocella sp. CWC-04]MCD1295566.1 voltage-gated chloride channel [Methanocella sp. CWC-04]
MAFEFKEESIIQQETDLFIGVLKWILYAAFIGIMVGVSTTIFLKALGWSTQYTHQYNYYFLLLPLAFFSSSWLIKKLASEAEGHGTDKVIEAVHLRSGKINPMVIPVKLVATVLTIAFGGSAGKEGPCAQIGAGLSSLFADIFKFSDEDRKKFVICGISAGFSSVFGTPIAGAIFGVEVLFVGNLLYGVLLPSFIAGMVSFYVTTLLGITYLYSPLPFVPDLSEMFLLKVIVSGVFFGICSLVLIECMNYFKKLSGKINASEHVKALVGGFSLVVLALIFSPMYLGLGMDTVESTVQGNTVEWYAFLLKMVFTGITLSFGGSGGILTPIFFIGSTAGVFFAEVFGLDIATFAAIGLVSVLSGATKSPIASSIMSIEIFGPHIGPYAAIACIISFIISGPRSVYPSQVFSLKKFI